jgi:Glycoside hydrolase family 44
MNNYTLNSSVAKAANITVDRFGGDAVSRYNYLLDVTSSAADYYFENQTGATGQQNTSQFNQQVASDAAIGAKTIASVNVLGWVAKDGTSCSFPTSTYPNQYAVEPYRSCGDGELQNQTNIIGASPTSTSIAVGPSFAGNWASYLAGKFGTAASGGVAIYSLDNEPAWWDVVHRDVHPLPSTYDEVTNNGIATAQAIKAADPTAQVTGPVVDNWWDYFYSKKDIESGWITGSCYQPWSNPVDRKVHGGFPFIEYYLQQFAAQQTAGKPRLLDYVDLHTYFAANYLGSSVGLTTAGNTGAQQARLNSTRVFWDPTYTDPANPQPNYTTDPNFTPSCSAPLQAPQLIPMMQSWIKNDYPGTKTAITEYNWGGQEHINGALAQADILGIFGSYGLDLGALWGPPNSTTQIPGLMAFEIYRNYDGNNSMFGNQAFASTSANQDLLSVYGALRTSDHAKTIVVINKTYGDLTSTLSLANLTATANETAQVFLYSNVNLSGIVPQTPVAVSPPLTGGTTSTMGMKFPAQSITLIVVP